MKTNLLFDFQVEKEKKTVTIIREFNATQDLVWRAFTEKELLDQWVAPQPYTSRTQYMDFKVGGSRFYAMVSPEGKESWAKQTYTSITPKSNFKMFNVFTDKDENPDEFGSEWDYTFSELDGVTKVVISIYNESFERLEGLLDGFKEGFRMSIENLEKLLEKLK